TGRALCPERLGHAQGRREGLRRGPRSGRRLLPRQADQPRRPALDRGPVHERRARAQGQGRGGALAEVILGGSAPPRHVAILHTPVDRREARARGLRRAGHQVTVVRPGSGAISTLLDATPDLVVATLYVGDQPIKEVMTLARAALGPDVALLTVLGREDVGSIVTADEVIREP